MIDPQRRAELITLADTVVSSLYVGSQFVAQAKDCARALREMLAEPTPQTLGGKVDAFEALLKSLSKVASGAIAKTLAEQFQMPPPEIRKGSNWVPPVPCRRAEEIARIICSDDGSRCQVYGCADLCQGVCKLDLSTLKKTDCWETAESIMALPSLSTEIADQTLQGDTAHHAADRNLVGGGTGVGPRSLPSVGIEDRRTPGGTWHRVPNEVWITELAGWAQDRRKPSLSTERVGRTSPVTDEELMDCYQHAGPAKPPEGE